MTLNIIATQVRKDICKDCNTPCDKFKKGRIIHDDPCQSCPIGRFKAVAELCHTARGLGDFVEKAVKPIAVFMRLSCLDDHGKLKEASPCAKRRDWLNRLGH